MYALKNDKLKYKPVILKMKGINIKMKYNKKTIDKENKKIIYSDMNKFTGKYKVDFEDYKLISEGYNLVCDNMNFLSGVKDMVIKDKGLLKIKNKKQISELYDKGDKDDDKNITPLIIWKIIYLIIINNTVDEL